jgi:hypothetical protein
MAVGLVPQDDPKGMRIRGWIAENPHSSNQEFQGNWWVCRHWPNHAYPSTPSNSQLQDRRTTI